MATIQLGGKHSNLYALVDDEMIDVVSGWKWFGVASKGTHYALTKAGGGRTWMHRLLLGAPDGMEVDHRNGNGLDNRLVNLRLATTAQNAQNRRPKPGRYKGVSLHFTSRGVSYRAQIYRDGKNRHLGLFSTLEDAAAAYDRAALEVFGEYAYLNGVKP